MASIESPQANVILVVDDNNTTRDLVTGVLVKAGFAVRAANNGAEGFEIFRELADHIALVLAEVTLPVIDGMTMAAKMTKYMPGTPIVLMSAFSASEIASGRGGSFAVLQKPFFARELLRIVNANLKPPSDGS